MSQDNVQKEMPQVPLAAAYDEYASWTDSVAKYPPTAEPFYLALGIADELGEWVDEVTKYRRKVQQTQDLSSRSSHITAQIKELGDTFWYIARYSTKVMGVPFSELIRDAEHSNGDGRDLHTCVGTICGVEKKRIRDGELWDNAKLTEKNAAAYSALRNLVRILMLCCIDINVPLVAVLGMNRSKLEKRLAEGSIRGDGDNR